MAWNFDKPMQSMSSEEERSDMIALWEAERHGGLTDGNNRLPLPLVFLMGLIILTAFMITMPIWGQRPNAQNYVEHIKIMNSPEIAALATNEEKMKRIDQIAMERAQGNGRQIGALERHPITYDDLLNIAPSIIEAQRAGDYPLDNYNVVGDKVKLANFEGNFRPDGKHERIQPWWDKGYTIDVFYVTYFIIVMILVVKRLPHFSQKPDMSKAT
ncbi:MAG: hypothetical protein ACC707_11995 [Thiohalomonadales bacterium]